MQIADINCGIGDKSNHSVYTNVNDLPVMNEKIKCIAKSVYEEFEQIIDKYEPDVAENMIPIISNVLENLDCAFTETHELEVECDRLRQNNTELTNQYEYERHLRKNFEEKLLEVEETYEGEMKKKMGNIESLTSTVKMLELKSQNQDQSEFKFF